jgi:hypothetical protein
MGDSSISFGFIVLVLVHCIIICVTLVNLFIYVPVFLSVGTIISKKIERAQRNV